MNSFEPESIKRASKYLDTKRLVKDDAHDSSHDDTKKIKSNWLERVVDVLFKRVLRLF